MTDYSQTATAGQSVAEPNCYLRIHSYLPGFIYDDKTTYIHLNPSAKSSGSKASLICQKTSWSALNAVAGCTATRGILFISGIYLLAEHSQIYALSITNSAVPDAMQPKARTSGSKLPAIG